MRDVAAIVQPAFDIDRIQREVAAAVIALQDAERVEKAATEKAERSREEAARRRLDLGRMLVEARKAWPSRGPKAKGWGEFLLKVGIAERTAQKYMQFAGHVEISASNEDEAETVPTYAAAGIDKRPRKMGPELDLVEPDDANDEEQVDGREMAAVGATLPKEGFMESDAPAKPRRVVRPVYEPLKRALDLIKGKGPFDVPLVEVERCLREALQALKEIQ